MQYIADLHIHSRYSRATSKASHLHGLAAWAAVKGIQVVGTGDFTHPAWFDHIAGTLEEAEPGFFRLRPAEAERLRTGEIDLTGLLPPGVMPDVAAIRFVLTAEISSIYKRGGRVRKVHNVLFAPDLEAARRCNASLAGIGNLEADGRPILGLDSRDLLEIQLETMPGGFLVPAHIWTPWFSLFGSRSGFDSIGECFGDLTDHVFALETGLSSDPDMNRRISALDRFTLISNSDCHSPAKLGREANLFDTGFDYFSMRDAIARPVDEQGRQVFAATIEFYPEEGKYHCDGHRKCGVCFEPDETIRHHGVCPRCGRPLTIGVLYRVMELADRKEPLYPPGSPAVHSLIPLPEILSELLGTGPATKKVMTAYGRLISAFGSEFDLLLRTPVDDIAAGASPMLAEAVRRVRENRVIRRPGFDGEFGVIRVFSDEERRGFGGQLSLFGVIAAKPRRKKKRAAPVFPVKKKQPPEQAASPTPDPEQEAAVTAPEGHVIVTAGPGAGKTFTLVRRVLRVAAAGDRPCTVITFTNRAADEVRQRLEAQGADHVFVATFHGYCLHWLRLHAPVGVAGPGLRRLLLRRLFPEKSDREIRQMAATIPAALIDDTGCEKEHHDSVLKKYLEALDEIEHVDIDGVVPRLTCLLRENGPEAAEVREGTGHLFIDEFQDLNRAQFALVRLLAETSAIFAIGDPDQAIYGFRGSDPAYFHCFIRELRPRQYVLARNYRSGSTIVAAAAAVIARNSDRQDIPARACRPQQGAVHVRQCASADDEAGFVAATVEQLLGGTSHREIDRLTPGTGTAASLADIAVLYRTGQQARPLAAALATRGLPCQVVNISAFFTTGASRILYLWTLALAGIADSARFLAIAGMEKGIGSKALQVMEQQLPLESGFGWPFFFDIVDRLENSAVHAALADLRSFADTMQARAGSEGLPRLLEPLLARYELDPADPDIERFHQLARSVGPSLISFAAHLERHADSVVYDPRAEAITLMTLHAAKGLEFAHVFITGVEEDLLPMALRSQADQAAPGRHIEEERRLFFVGMTRARETLYLTHAARRPGRSGCRPSRFLAEIPPELLSRPEVRGSRKKRRYRQLSLF
ncbi:UvrD-helicase domain-containing protein [Thermodesulfobacteriota bacterium B35]